MSEHSFNKEQHRKLFEHTRKRALDCLNDSEYSRAFGHLLVALNIDQDDEDLMNIFLFVLGLLSNQLEKQEEWMSLLSCYEEALNILPYSSEILHGLATALFRLGHLESAMTYFQRAYRENPYFTPSLYCLDNLRNVLVERWHFIMLNDKVRNSAFQQSIKNAVDKGYDTILDIGAGTGILSLMAVKAGAKSVYACESSAVMFEIMKNVIEANSKDIHAIGKFSYDVIVPDDMPERVSLVITETFDAGLFGEHVLDIVSDAWKRLLRVNNEKEGNAGGESNTLQSTPVKAKILPQSAVVYSMPIQCETLRKQIKVDAGVTKVLSIEDVELSSSVAHSEPYSTERLKGIHGGYTPLSQANAIMRVDFNNREQVDDLRKGQSFHLEYECIHDGQIDAIAVWFDLQLDDDITISTSPDEVETCWEQAIFYVSPSLLTGSSVVKIGDVVKAEFSCKTCLSLVKIVSPLSSESKEVRSVHSTLIQSLNRHHLDRTLYMNLVKDRASGECCVLDMSLIPVLGLKSVKDHVKNVITLPCKYQFNIDELKHICKLSKETTQVMFYENICAGHTPFDVCITEPVDGSGLLRKNILEDIAFLRNRNSSHVPDIYPRKLSIFSMLIESPFLYKRSKIVSDDNCLDFKISKFLNVYQCKIHQDIQLQTLPHTPLCEAVKLCDIHLNDISLEKNKLQSWVEFHGNVTVHVKQDGTVSAIPFWFEMTYDDDNIVTTLSPNPLWKQAAVILDEAVSVSAGETVKLNWICRNSCLFITLSKS